MVNFRQTLGVRTKENKRVKGSRLRNWECAATIASGRMGKPATSFVYTSTRSLMQAHLPMVTPVELERLQQALASEELNKRQPSHKREFVMAISGGTKTIRAVTLLAVAGLFALPSLAKAQEETWKQTAIIPIPGLASFDISFVETANQRYLLADRSNKTVDQYAIPAGVLLPPYQGNFVGTALTSTGTVNNDLSGPNGVLAFFNPDSGTYEVWVGDGPQTNAGCETFLGGVCSAVKIFDLAGLPDPAKAVVPTGGAARADELCHDPTHKLVLIANDAEADFKFGTPFITFISTTNYKIVGSLQIPSATNGIEQCVWDPASGLFFLNLPEANGPGNDTADGEVLAISPTTFQIVATYIIPTAACAGPQGMALGPEPQLLLGCNAVGPFGVRNSLIINKHNGQVIAIGWGIGGADQVYFNPTGSHYWVTGSSCTATTCLSGTVQQLVAIDATGSLSVDQVIPLLKFGAISAHSVAADPTSGLTFSPNAGGVVIFTPSALDSDDPNSPAWPE